MAKPRAVKRKTEMPWFRYLQQSDCMLVSHQRVQGAKREGLTAALALLAFAAM